MLFLPAAAPAARMQAKCRACTAACGGDLAPMAAHVCVQFRNLAIGLARASQSCGALLKIGRWGIHGEACAV